MFSNQESSHPRINEKLHKAKHMVSGAKKKRLVSLDALRGFDMFWIIGGHALAAGLISLNLPGGAALAGQLVHTKWNGFTFYDLIFPLFIFITGVSLVLSIQKRLAKGDSRGTIVGHILLRTVALFLLGILYNGVDIHKPLINSIRFMGVLQRSALCYFFGSMLVLYTKPRTQAITAVSILVGYWAVMRFVPVPGFGAGIWTEQGNLARYIDSLLLPGHLYFGSWDPESLLSTIPAVATCLLGVLSGHWLRTTEWRNRAISGNQGALYLLLVGLGLAILGLLISPIFPINKSLWTSSFVLLTGGFSAILLAIFHWLIDIRGYRQIAFPFVLIGMNSIFIYLAARFIPFDNITQWIAQGNFFAFFGSGQTLFAALATFFLEGLLLLLLYNRKKFIRI